MALVLPFPVGGSSSQALEQEHRVQRDQLRQHINRLLADIQSVEGSRDVLAEKLATAEKEIGALARKLQALDELLQVQQQERHRLQSQQKHLLDKLHQERSALARQIRSAYLMGRQERLRILLNQQQPETVARVMAYYDYLAMARARSMEEINHQLQQLQQLQEELTRQEKLLEQTRSRQLAEQQSLEKAQLTRRNTIEALSVQLEKSGQQLAQLQRDERRLNELISGLQQALRDMEIPQQKSFNQKKGLLAWPAKGRISASFGSAKIEDMRWDGVVISAPEGQPVRSVHSGRVAYADWLRGFGLLLIIDHGDDYMTLYGFNQSLFKETGDWVEPGEVIALVGNSGGQRRAGLYFGIRYKGKAKNPKAWCKKVSGRRVG